MKLKFWIGMLISVLCLYFVFRGIEWHKVVAVLGQVNYLYLIIGALVHLSTIWVRAERWKYLLAPVKAFDFRQLVPATAIGFMANNILPARAGEFIRAYIIGKKARISGTASFATIILERVFDMVTMLFFLVVVLLFIKFPPALDPAQQSLLSPTLMKEMGLLSAIFVAGLVLFLVLFKEFPQKTRAVVQKMLTPLPKVLQGKVLGLLDSFRLGLQVLTAGKHLVYLIGWSLVVWGAYAFGNWLMLWAFGLQLSLLAAIFIMVLIAFSVALPSSPGYIGPFHAAIVAGILFFLPGYDRSSAAGIAIVFHLIAVGPVTLLGLFYLWQENLSLAEIQHLEKTEEAEISREMPKS